MRDFGFTVQFQKQLHHGTHDKAKFLFSSHQCRLPSNLVLAMLWKMVGMKLRKLGSKLLGNVKLTQKAKRLTRFCLLL